MGREQSGNRPCVVVSDEALLKDQRYPIFAVVPFTGTLNLPAMYPIVEAYSHGLTKRSSALVDQVRSIDKSRLTRVFAPIPAPDMRRIEDALRRFLGL
jgi:mRNA interferase MazF